MASQNESGLSWGQKLGGHSRVTDSITLRMPGSLIGYGRKACYTRQLGPKQPWEGGTAVAASELHILTAECETEGEMQRPAYNAVPAVRQNR